MRRLRRARELSEALRGFKPGYSPRPGYLARVTSPGKARGSRHLRGQAAAYGNRGATGHRVSRRDACRPRLRPGDRAGREALAARTGDRGVMLLRLAGVAAFVRVRP